MFHRVNFTQTGSLNRLLRSAAMSIIAGLGLAFTLAPIADAKEIVTLSKTHMIKLNQPASAIIIGDPEIADISVHADNILFLLGRSYGETDLIILDAYGNTILQTDIAVVGNQSSSQVSLIKAGEGRETYHCSPHCQASPKLGDSPEFIGAHAAIRATAQNGTAILSEPSLANPASQNDNFFDEEF